eukprot:75894_1
MANLHQRASMIITHVLSKQRLLLESYIQNERTIYMPEDIIHVCSIFFQIDIKLLNNRNYIMTNDDFYQLSKSFYQQSEYYLSYEILQYLISFNKDNYKYHNLLARILYKWQMYESSNKEFKIAIKLYPKDYHIICMFGISLMKQNMFGLALQEFIKAGEIEPNKSKYLLYSVDCYIALNQYENAQINFGKLFQTIPDKSTKQLYYFMKFAKFLYTIKNYSDSQQYFEKSIGIESHNWIHIHKLSKYLGNNYLKNYNFNELEYYNNNYLVLKQLYKLNPL